MVRKLTWGLLGFAAGAYLMARADNRTRRTWRRQARRLGRRVERATNKAMRSPSMQWVNDTMDALAVR